MSRGTSTRILLALVVGTAAAILLWRYSPGGSGPSAEELAGAALNATNVNERSVAAARLADQGEASRTALRHVLSQSTQADVQAVCVDGLAALWDYDSMNDFLGLAESDSEQVRGRAAQAIMRMTGRQRPYSSAAPVEERRLLVRHMRADWEEIKRASPQAREELFRRLRESHEHPQ